MAMTTRNRTLRHAAPFAAGVLIGLSVVTPVFAATLDIQRLQPLVLLGSLIVLLIGLTLKAVATPKGDKGKSRVDEQIPETDLRFQPTGSAIMDIPLPRTSLR
jgi:hypothetical protein